MQKLILTDSTVLWLEHYQLINDAYKEVSGNPNTCYELRKELFYFHASTKTRSSNQKQIDVDANLQETVGLKKQKIKQLKRKKSDTIATQQPVLETKIAAFLLRLKKMGFENSDEPTAAIPRFWEEQHEFPKFKGANSTDQFQSFSFGEQTYLIPARCKFYNHDVTKLNEILGELEPFDLIVVDPPWRNKYIRRLKKLKLELAYDMLDSMQLQKIPIAQLIKRQSLVAIWCTNSKQHQKDVIEKLLPAWNLRLVNAIRWLKINTSGDLIGNINEIGKKQPYEMLFIACHKEQEHDFIGLKSIDLIGSIPSIVHSHKPPLLQWLQEYLPVKARCLELFARYLQPHFTSIGLEVFKLMDQRLFVKKELK